MQNLSVRRTVARLSLAGLAAAGLASVPSASYAAVEDASIGVGTYVGDDASCEVSGGGDSTEAPWTDNGAPVTQTVSTSGTVQAGDDDVVEVSGSGTASIASTPLGSGPATITGSATVSASALARAASTECDVESGASTEAAATFTLAKPMWVTLTARGKGDGNAVVGVGNLESDFFFGAGDGLVVTTGKQGTAVSSTLLPAGQYQVFYGAVARATATGTTEGTATYAGSFEIGMEALGSASAVQGKGASYIAFGARDCATGSVPAVVGKKLVKKAKRLVIKVDGKKVVALKGKKLKKRTLVLPTPAASMTEVKAKITLDNGRRVKAIRSYLPCS